LRFPDVNPALTSALTTHNRRGADLYRKRVCQALDPSNGEVEL